MFIRRSLLALALAAAFAACGPEVPNHSHNPPQPPPLPEAKPSGKVESFAIAPSAIKKGESATISWATSDAVSVALKDRSGKGVPGVDSTMINGEVEVSPTETTTYVLQAIGEGGSDYAIAQIRVQDEALEIPEAPLLLSALPEQILAEQQTALVWSGPGPVSITDDQNNTLDTGNAASGSLEISPTRTTTYTARAGSQEVKVTVKVIPVVKLFVATPSGAAAGSDVTLNWETVGAAKVTISANVRGGTLYEAHENEAVKGQFNDVIPEELENGSVIEYVLTAESPTRELATQNLIFTVSTVPTIASFGGTEILTRGSSTRPTLTWSTSGAAKVTIYRGPTGSTPNEVLFIAPSNRLSSGTIEVETPLDDTDYLLVAEASQGGQVSKVHTLRMVNLPEIVDFTITPDTITTPGEQAQVQWTTNEGTEVIVAPVDGSSLFASTEPTEVKAGTATITAGNTTEFELIVRNAAGDAVRATRTLNVTNPIGFVFDPPIAIPGQQVDMVWDFPGAVGVTGAPVGETSVGTEPFIDLTGSTTAQELETLGGTSSARAEKLVFPDGFKFRHFGVLYDSVQVTNRGWISFDESVTATNISASIPSTGAPNNYIAAWAGESLSNGKVLWEIQGTAPNRELIIQWNEFSGAATGSKLTFELILFESGMVQARYLEMTSAGGTVTIGMEDATGRVGYASSVLAPPAANDAITFHGPAAPSGSAAILAGASPATYSLLVDLGTAKVPVSATLPVVPAGAIAIREVMYKPLASASEGKWIEIQNQFNMELPLDAFTVKSSVGTFALPTHAFAPGEILVIGQSSDTSVNGDTPVDVVVPGFDLSPISDAVEIALGNGTVAKLPYDDTKLAATHGVSISPNTKLFPHFCPSTEPYGTAGSMGSPGVTGTSSCEVAPTTIAGDYFSLASTGTLMLEDEPDSREILEFPAGFSFPFDGVPRTSALVGHGYISFDVSHGASSRDPFNATPALFPDPDGLKGVIAPLWQRYGFNPYAVYTRIRWQHFPDPDGNPSTPDGYLAIDWSGLGPYWATFDDFDGFVNIQARLFENGDVEFHYGSLAIGDCSWIWLTGECYLEGYEDGSGAVIGITNMTNTYATIFGFNEAKLAENMAIRFSAY